MNFTRDFPWHWGSDDAGNITTNDPRTLPDGGWMLRAPDFGFAFPPEAVTVFPRAMRAVGGTDGGHA